ncbi:MAG: hypothetical protein IJA02_03670 [Clostridia bacterium]|nr:hypothetical protein [Clostridia bacterium]
MIEGKAMVKNAAVAGVAVLCASMLLVFARQAVCGAAKGLETCAGVIIPSLFPFLAVSAFAAVSPSCKSAMRFLSPVMRHVFRLPSAAAPAVLFGLIGGYPVGCTTAAQLYARGEINTEQAQRITCFCVNAGPAFVITAVGSVMLSSIKAGVILFASCMAASLLIGIMLGFTAEKPIADKAKPISNISDIQALVEATEKAAASIIKICAWTVLFACIYAVVENSGAKKEILTAFECLFEVTGGCRELAKGSNLCTIAAALGWGGLCVCCQVMESVRKTGAKLSVFFAFRALHAALAAVICSVLLKVFPVETDVFSNVAAVTANGFSYSVPATAALMCLCAVFVIDLDRSKKMC